MNGYVDAHQHIWRLERGDYGWLTPALAPIHRDFTLDDLRPLAAAAGIETTVLVQAAPTLAETRFLLAAAKASRGLVGGVVGWVDLANAQATGTLEALAGNPLLKGIRPMLHDLPEADWILRADVQPALAALSRLGLRFDALVRPRELAALRRMLDLHPALAIIVDHGAKPPIAARGWQPWADDLAAIARHPGVHCKLSGLVTEAGPHWATGDLRRYVDHLLATFGPGRLVWGSDWPVVDLAGGYAQWVAATGSLLAGLSAPEQAAIRGANARRFYGL
jgi:L-fuconolactonase